MITISIKDKFAEVNYKEGSRNTSKVISLGDLHKVFNEKSSHDTGPFPSFGDSNTVSIHRIIKKGDKTLLLIQGVNLCINTKANDFPTNLSKKKVPFVKEVYREGFTEVGMDEDGYDDEYSDEGGIDYVYENVFYPNLLMAVVLHEQNKKFRVGNTGLSCFEFPFLDDKTPMYKFPFANVYDEMAGRICWGSNAMPSFDNPGQAVSLLHSFLGAPMNTDLFRRVNDGPYKAGTSYELLYKLAEKYDRLNSFPFDQIKLPKLSDYKSLINYYTTNWI